MSRKERAEDLPKNLIRHPESQILYVRAMINGRRRKISTGEIAVGRAERRRDEIMVQLRDNVKGWTKKVVPTFGAWWQTFQDTYFAEGTVHYADSTQSLYRHVVGRALPLLGNKALDEVLKSVCVKHLNQLTKEGYAPDTIATACSVLKHLFNRAIDDKLIEDNPWVGLELADCVPRRRILTAAEQEAIWPYLASVDQRWCLLILGTGLRIGEVTWLTPKYIHWEDQTLEVLGKGRRKKGRKWRHVPMVPEVVQVLRDQITETACESGRLWPEHLVTLETRLRKACAKAGIAPGVTPHTLRHTYATRYVEAGGNIVHLSLNLGHASVDFTVKMYVHVSTDSRVKDACRVNLGLTPDAAGKVLEFPERTGTDGPSSGPTPPGGRWRKGKNTM